MQKAIDFICIYCTITTFQREALLLFSFIRTPRRFVWIARDRKERLTLFSVNVLVQQDSFVPRKFYGDSCHHYHLPGCRTKVAA